MVLAPGHAHRDVGAPRGAGQPRHARAAGRPRRPARGGPAGRRRRRRGPPGRTRRRSSPRSSGCWRRAAISPGLQVLVTAGGTREPIDPVRFIANRSSGKQGHALAAEAAGAGRQGHPGHHRRPARRRARVDVVRVETAAEMDEAVRAVASAADVVVMAAAVADFRPAQVAAQQDQEGRRRCPRSSSSRPSTSSPPSAHASARARPLVGFAAETDRRAGRSNVDKLVAKGADLDRRQRRLGRGRWVRARHQQVVIIACRRH